MRALLIAALLLPSCASDAGSAAPTTSPARARTYESLDAITDDLGCSDFERVGTGGNPGLRDFGVCFLGPHNLDVYLVSDGSWDHLTDEFHAVSGPGWIVVCPTGAKAARMVEAKLGGTVSEPGDA